MSRQSPNIFSQLPKQLNNVSLTIMNSAHLTPNHLDKRRQIIKAAQNILRREGIVACSSRAIAKESGFNKGLIHYYFNTVEQIIDEAIDEMVDKIVKKIRSTCARHEDPLQRFWSVVEVHLSAFERPKGQTVLWMDYWTHTMHKSRGPILRRIDEAIIAAHTDALTEAKISEPDTRARAITAYVMGVAIRRAMGPQNDEELRREIKLMCGDLETTAA